jgi:hypothetical protein
LKRFSVSERFAGKKGPCPQCKTIIEIPKEEVKIHAPDEAVRDGKAVVGGVNIAPLERVTRDFDVEHAKRAAGIVAALLFVSLILGFFRIPATFLDVVGGLCVIVIGVPVALYGYLTFLDRETLFVWTGNDLYKRSAVCGAAYGILWIIMELALWYSGASTNVVSLVMIIVLFGSMSVLAPYITFDFNINQAIGHYSAFFILVLILRGLIGLGWLWTITAKQNPLLM